MLNNDLSVLANKVTRKRFVVIAWSVPGVYWIPWLCSELEARLQESEDHLEQLKQVLREATGKHQNLIRHLKLVENRATHAEYDGQSKLPRCNRLDSLQRYIQCTTFLLVAAWRCPVLHYSVHNYNNSTIRAVLASIPGPRERGPGVHCLRVAIVNFLVKLFVIYQLEPVACTG